MNYISRIVTVVLLFLIPVAAFSQKDESKPQQSSRSSGLKKVASGKSVDVHINQEQLEVDIEKAVEMAMASVEASLQQLGYLELNLEPIEINLTGLNFDPIDIDMEPIAIDITEFNIDLDLGPIAIDLSDLTTELEDLEIELINPDIELEEPDFDDEWINKNQDEGEEVDASKNSEAKDNAEKSKQKTAKTKAGKPDLKKSPKQKPDKNEKAKGMKKID